MSDPTPLRDESVAYLIGSVLGAITPGLLVAVALKLFVPSVRTLSWGLALAIGAATSLVVRGGLWLMGVGPPWSSLAAAVAAAIVLLVLPRRSRA